MKIKCTRVRRHHCTTLRLSPDNHFLNPRIIIEASPKGYRYESKEIIHQQISHHNSIPIFFIKIDALIELQMPSFSS
jgi:hypothetical protein